VIYGHVRDDFPRVSLWLPGLSGKLKVEFIFDTGFDDWFTLPPDVVRRLDLIPDGPRLTRFAGGGIRSVNCYLMQLEWQDEAVEVEVLEMEGNALLGTRALRGNLIQIEMTDGGEVSVEALE
jgi:predicted aspartyl protease